jgi:hypothetical protein
MGFHKFFMDKSDAMWAKGKAMMKYVLQRGGKMGNGFQVIKNAPKQTLIKSMVTVIQIPPIGSPQSLNTLDYSNEMKVNKNIKIKTTWQTLYADVFKCRLCNILRVLV